MTQRARCNEPIEAQRLRVPLGGHRVEAFDVVWGGGTSRRDLESRTGSRSWPSQLSARGSGVAQPRAKSLLILRIRGVQSMNRMLCVRHMA
jgi:hypothetical protein